MDQRGCGKSTPHAELEENNTQEKFQQTIIVLNKAYKKRILVLNKRKIFTTKK